jgi:predicted enzyme related to lactoylglutathione lyase
MSETSEDRAVIQMRLVVEAEDFEEAVAFYRDSLGLREELSVAGEGGAEVIILDAGRATLELINSAQRRFIDEVEVGRQVSRKIRVAFEVRDVGSETERLVSSGADLIAEPVETPWRSRNSSMEAPAGLQITLFEELETDSPNPYEQADRDRH